MFAIFWMSSSLKVRSVRSIMWPSSRASMKSTWLVRSMVPLEPAFLSLAKNQTQTDLRAAEELCRKCDDARDDRLRP